jgi:hypothetical protein
MALMTRTAAPYYCTYSQPLHLFISNGPYRKALGSRRRCPSFLAPRDLNDIPQFSYIIIRVSRGTSYGESTVNGTTTSLGRYRPNNRPFDSGQSFSTRSAGKSEVQIRLERTTDGPMGIEMDSSSANEEVNVAKYASA